MRLKWRRPRGAYLVGGVAGEGADGALDEAGGRVHVGLDGGGAGFVVGRHDVLVVEDGLAVKDGLAVEDGLADVIGV